MNEAEILNTQKVLERRIAELEKILAADQSNETQSCLGDQLIRCIEIHGRLVGLL